MDEERRRYLCGVELPDAATISSMLVNTGKAGIKAKLKSLGT